MKNLRPGIACLVAVACGGGGSDPAELEISQRPATDAECTNGGLVLVVNRQVQPAICNGGEGSPGEPGRDGTPGTSGPAGARGAPGVSGPAGRDALDPSNVVDGIVAKAAAVVIVECTEDGLTFSGGSGTKTTAGTVITAEHVFGENTTCDVYTEAPVTLLGSATSVDYRGERDEIELTMAWTAAGNAVAGIAPLLGTAPEIGDLVTVVGHPGLYDGVTLEHQYTTGHVTATSLQATFSTVPLLDGKATAWESGWSTDAVAWHGNSGGPVFDAGGNWIGILVGAFNGGADNEGPDLSVVLPLF